MMNWWGIIRWSPWSRCAWASLCYTGPFHVGLPSAHIPSQMKWQLPDYYGHNRRHPFASRDSGDRSVFPCRGTCSWRLQTTWPDGKNTAVQFRLWTSKGWDASNSIVSHSLHTNLSIRALLSHSLCYEVLSMVWSNELRRELHAAFGWTTRS